MNDLRAVKGMNDILPEQMGHWHRIESLCRRIFPLYGYDEIRTPVVEDLSLFVRSVGEGTDIVEKEMYVLQDRDGKSLSLRPEGTAGVVRSVIEHHVFPQSMEYKVFYIGPMFRRERPQKGRLRQFYQIGAEALGMEDGSVDVEVMGMLFDLFDQLGLKGLRLDINSLGEPSERRGYVDALIAYYTQAEAQLCEDCRRRLRQNPLRLLDCKQEGCVALAQKAPEILAYLGEASLAHFEGVKAGLSSQGISYYVSPRLVRGLDYYTRTVFEISASSGLGSQNAVAAGGRYDHLVENMGGPKTPAFGFAAGVERIILLLEELAQPLPKKPPLLCLVHADASGRALCETLAFKLRKLGCAISFDHHLRSVKAQMRRADKLDATAVIVLGETEAKAKSGVLKMLSTKESNPVSLEVDNLKGIMDFWV